MAEVPVIDVSDLASPDLAARRGVAAALGAAFFLDPNPDAVVAAYLKERLDATYAHRG